MKMNARAICITLYFTLLCGVACAIHDDGDETGGEEPLVEIRYNVAGRFTIARWITEKHNGATRLSSMSIGSRDDSHTSDEAAECLKLLKAAKEPAHLPNDMKQIVYVQCADGSGGMLEKQFDAANLPQELRGMLRAMGYACGAQSFDGLQFAASPASEQEKTQADQRAQIDDLQKQARSVVIMGNNYTKAADLYTQALALDTKSVPLLMERAGAYSASKQLDLAAADYATVIQLDPKNEEPYKRRAIMFRSKLAREKAIEAFTAWIAFNPKATQAYEERGFLYQWKDDDKMIADLSHAIALYEQGIGEVKGSVYSERGEAYLRKGEKEKGLADLAKAIAINPDSSDAYSTRAPVYFDSGEFEKAFADYDKAVELKPKDLNVFVARGYAYYHHGEWAKALADADNVEAIRPNWWNAMVLRGKVYAAQEMYDKEIAEYLRLIGSDPRDSSGKNAAAWFYATCPDAKFRDGAKAVDLAMESCGAANWRSHTRIDTLAVAYAESGDFEKATNYEKLAIETAGNDDKAAKEYTSRLPLYEQKKAYHEEKKP